MNYRSPINLAIATLFIAGNAYAAPAVDLKAVVEKAILENPEVQGKYKLFSAAGNEKDVAKSAWRPTIDLNNSSTDGTTYNGYAGMRQDAGYTSSATTLQLRQTVFDGFATSREVRRLGHAHVGAYYDLVATSDKIALEAARAYLDVQRYRALVELAKENYATHADIHARLDARVKAGVGRRVDLEQASGRMALSESNWLTEASNLHDVTARYQRLVGEVPAPELNEAPNFTSFLPPRDKKISDTIRTSPEFLSTVSTIRSLRADADARYAGLYPTLELRAAQSEERNRTTASGAYRDSSLQLVMNYNLYRGGADRARIRQFADRLNAAYDSRDKICRDLHQNAQMAMNDVGKLETQLNFLSQHELSTAKAREAYRQQFDIGQRTLLDMLNTENEYYEARKSLVGAEYDLSLAKIRVLSADGTFLSAIKLRSVKVNAPDAAAGMSAGDDAVACSTTLVPQLVLDKDSLPTLAATLGTDPMVAAADAAAQKTATAAVAGGAPAPSSTGASAKPAVAACDAVMPAVEKWAAAWNGNDVTAYLAAYASTFVPAKGLSRAEWEKMRTQRVKKPGELVARLKNVSPTRCDGKTTEVTFMQEYKSKDYSDVVEKTLSLGFVDGSWKILKETVNNGRSY